MKSSIYICLSMLLVSAMLPVYAQDELRPLYDSLFQTKNHLIKGKVVGKTLPRGKGHPYFGQSGWQSGIVSLEGMRIPCKSLRYDLLNDHLLVQHFSRTESFVIELNRNFTRQFELGGNIFCYLDESLVLNSGLKPGYFETVYRSETELWIKWGKEFTGGSSGSGQFEQSRNFYIKNGGRYFRITGRKSLLDAFQDLELEIKEFLKQQGISVRRVGTEELITVVRFYDDNKTN